MIYDILKIMIRVIIGSVGDRVTIRPGIHDTDPEHAEYWNYIVGYITQRIQFQIPVPDTDYMLNPFFGLFGMCYNPSSRQSRSFHLGLDLATTYRQAVKPITSGILEYAGYSLANGHYVMLSHPMITSEDGFVLHSLYISLHSAAVGFTRYQKMLREISLRSHPQIHIPDDMIIGYVGESGDIAGLHTHMHLQCEFRHPDGRIIAVDPASFLGLPADGNITHDIENHETFMELYPLHEEDIKKSFLEKYWK